jgi:hypothetical protein
VNLWWTRNRTGVGEWLATPADLKADPGMQQLRDALLWVRSHTESDAVLVANACTPENMKKDHWGALDRTLTHADRRAFLLLGVVGAPAVVRGSGVHHGHFAGAIEGEPGVGIFLPETAAGLERSDRWPMLRPGGSQHQRRRYGLAVGGRANIFQCTNRHLPHVPWRRGCDGRRRLRARRKDPASRCWSANTPRRGAALGSTGNCVTLTSICRLAVAHTGAARHHKLFNCLAPGSTRSPPVGPPGIGVRLDRRVVRAGGDRRDGGAGVWL